MKGFRKAGYRIKLYSLALCIIGVLIVSVQFVELEAHLRTVGTLILVAVCLILVFQTDRCAFYFFNNLMMDELTKVYNYRYFITRLEEEMKRSARYERPLVLAFIDCDDFKSFNDRYGHLEGNHVLERLGKVLKTNTRASDIVARFGGDEFAVILPETDMVCARTVIERVRVLVENTAFKAGPGEITLSVSLVDYRGEDLGTFIRRADATLYLEKSVKKGKMIEQRA